MPFYHSVRVAEALIVNRQPWQLVLYRRVDNELKEVGLETVKSKALLASTIVPLTFQLDIGEDRPQIEANKHPVGGEEKQRWLV